MRAGSWGLPSIEVRTAPGGKPSDYNQATQGDLLARYRRPAHAQRLAWQAAPQYPGGCVVVDAASKEVLGYWPSKEEA